MIIRLGLSLTKELKSLVKYRCSQLPKHYARAKGIFTRLARTGLLETATIHISEDVCIVALPETKNNLCFVFGRGVSYCVGFDPNLPLRFSYKKSTDKVVWQEVIDEYRLRHPNSFIAEEWTHFENDQASKLFKLMEKEK